jgi:Holliday junction resolvase
MSIDLTTIKALDDLSPYLPKELWDEVRDNIGVSEEEFNQRMKGIYRESDFLLAIHMMDVCKNITLIDESVSSVFGTYSCDAIIEMNNSSKFLLEIKHTDKDKYKISENNFNKRVEYAKTLELKLYFAISIKGLWMVLSSDYLDKNDRKITIDDYKYSELSSLFSVDHYIIEDFEFISIYANRKKNTIGIQYPPYGFLVSEEIKHKGKRKYKIKRNNKDLFYITFVIEGIKDRASNEYHDEVKDGDFTIITDKIEKGSQHMISELELLLSPIKHMIHYDNIVFTPKTYLSELSKLGKTSPFKVQLLRATMNQFGLKRIKMTTPQS